MLTVLFFVAASAFGDTAEDYYTNGIAKGDKGDLNGAIADYNKAIELKPDDYYAYFNRGVVKRDKGDTNGAQSDFKKTIELNPKLRDVIEAKGYLTSGTNSN